MSFTSIKGFTNLAEKSYPEIVEDSLLDFFDWGFLKVGNVVNVNIPTSGVYGGSFHQLRCQNDPRYTTGKVWQSAHKNWIWESGTSLPVQPIRISGVFINGSLTGTGYTVDYPNGRIIFNTALSPASVVSLNYSYKHVSFLSDNFNGLLREVKTNGNRPDNAHFAIRGSGSWDKLAESRVDVPFVCLERVEGDSNTPYQLGGAYYSRTTFLAHVVGDNEKFVERIAGIIADQSNKSFYGVDYNKVARSGVYPLSYDGSLSSSPLTFENMVEGQYCWRKIHIFNGKAQQTNEVMPGLYHVPVRFTTDVVKGDY